MQLRGLERKPVIAEHEDDEEAGGEIGGSMAESSHASVRLFISSLILQFPLTVDGL